MRSRGIFRDNMELHRENGLRFLVKRMMLKKERIPSVKKNHIKSSRKNKRSLLRVQSLPKRRKRTEK